jgi:hypothetical protein
MSYINDKRQSKRLVPPLKKLLDSSRGLFDIPAGSSIGFKGRNSEVERSILFFKRSKSAHEPSRNHRDAIPLENNLRSCSHATHAS